MGACAEGADGQEIRSDVDEECASYAVGAGLDEFSGSYRGDSMVVGARSDSLASRGGTRVCRRGRSSLGARRPTAFETPLREMSRPRKA